MLVGTASYEAPLLPDVPVIANNISDLAQVFTHEDLGGFSPFHCLAVPSAAGVAQVGDALVRAAEEAEDLLLFYYSGHGLLGPRRRELYLSLAATRPDRLAFTALPFEAVRDACLDSSAKSRVVILDSCFSGRAIGETLAGDDASVLGELEVAGTYTLTSSPANRTAVILPGERHTAFTERLLTLLRAGSPAAGTMISLGDIYRHLHTQLRAEGLPTPQQCGTHTSDLLGLVRNARSAHVSGMASAVDVGAPGRTADPDKTSRLAHAESIAKTIGNGLRRARALAQVALAAATVGGPERVARLIDQAESAVDTISDQYSKVMALTAVATAAAVADPERAMLLFDRAERTASTAKADMAQAMSVVVAAVAASDPDRAEGIAHATPHTLTRDRALAALAKSVATSDLDRAERCAYAITGKGAREDALFSLVKAAAADACDRAEGIANAITNQDVRWSALAAVAAAVAAKDPDRAERIAKEITYKYRRWAALTDVARAVAANDPERAECIANEIADKYSRWPLLCSMAPIMMNAMTTAVTSAAKAVAATDPDRAERMADTIADKYAQVTVLTFTAQTVAAADPGRAERLINRAEQTASTVRQDKVRALTAVVTAVAATSGPDRAEDMAYGITPEHTKEDVLVALAKVLAIDDPNRVVRIADTINDKSRRTSVLAAAAKAVAVGDPDRAESIADTITDKSRRLSVLAAVGKAVAASDPDRAERIANRMHDHHAAGEVLGSVVSAVAVTDPDRARLIAHRVPGTARERILYETVLALLMPSSS
ncbi:caspase family protein [Streptomyces sp. KR55]|uniref:caspase family protein n=1 Tax=Streptomyces sp. KR55 TaxID=3457425 RepID=UPI003FD380D4